MDPQPGKQIRLSIPITPAPVGRTPPVTMPGAVSDHERAQAAAAISAVLERNRRTVDHARVRISTSPYDGRPGLVQVNLRICGAPARVQAAAKTLTLAVSTAATRLQRHITRLTTAWEPWPWPDPERRPLGIPGPAPISRLKSYHLHAAMPCQAAAFMNAMDYDVFLYTDAETGEDAIVYRAGPTGLCLARQKTMRPPSMPTLLPLTVNPRKTPILTTAQATARLAEHWLPFVFYTDYGSRRANLLYRRYDGDLGLIAPTNLDNQA